MRYVSFLLFIITAPVIAQTNRNPDYSPPTASPQYMPGTRIDSTTIDVSPAGRRQYIQADPDLSNGHPRSRQVILGPGSDHTRERWYVALEGTVRINTGQLTNTLNSLLSTQGTTKFGGGAATGVILNERWAIELAYLYQPLHNTLLLANGRSPIMLRYANGGNSFLLRGKVRLGLEGKNSNGAGLWLTGGLGLVPNNGQSLDSLAFQGYVQRTRRTADTLHLLVDTYQNIRWSGLAEVGAEYVVRAGHYTELAFSLRRYQALSYSLRTSVSYTVNQAEPTIATLSSGGTGWGFGLVWRFSYGLKP